VRGRCLDLPRVNLLSGPGIGDSQRADDKDLESVKLVGETGSLVGNPRPVDGDLVAVNGRFEQLRDLRLARHE
jgi:hypothetical protein